MGLAAYIKRTDLDARYNYAKVAEGFANRDLDSAVAWVEGLKSGEPLHYQHIYRLFANESSGSRPMLHDSL